MDESQLAEDVVSWDYGWCCPIVGRTCCEIFRGGRAAIVIVNDAWWMAFLHSPWTWPPKIISAFLMNFPTPQNHHFLCRWYNNPAKEIHFKEGVEMNGNLELSNCSLSFWALPFFGFAKTSAHASKKWPKHNHWPLYNQETSVDALSISNVTVVMVNAIIVNCIAYELTFRPSAFFFLLAFGFLGSNSFHYQSDSQAPLYLHK